MRCSRAATSGRTSWAAWWAPRAWWRASACRWGRSPAAGFSMLSAPIPGSTSARSPSAWARWRSRSLSLPPEFRRSMLMGNPVVHFELMSKNPEKVSDFYAKNFGWKVKHMPEINYRLVDTDAKASGMPGINGGIVKPDKPEPWPGNMLCYILVDDLAAYRKKVKAQ